MAEQTGISWADGTFNPWVGCTAVSPACAYCYAEARVTRFGGDFSVRRRTAPANWRQPVIWNRKAAKAGVRKRVFCASLADAFDNQVPEDWRTDLWALIRATPHLDWMLLTKRPQNIAKMLPPDWGDGWLNVWLGTTCENQTEADRRIPHLLDVPAAVHFLSCEPLLGPLDLTWALYDGKWQRPRHCIDWVIVGGESGLHARPMHPHWARSLRDHCVESGIWRDTTGVAFHFKQWGEWAPYSVAAGGDLGGEVRRGRVRIVHPTGETELEVFERTGINTIKGSRYMQRVGVKRAGHMLDGVAWQQFPASPAAHSFNKEPEHV